MSGVIVPLTFLAHQSFVIPLKWARPGWFDGTALCAGSMAPDLAYALEGTPLAFPSHTLSAQLAFSLPVACALTLVWRHLVAEPFGASVPGQMGEEIRSLSLARRSAWSTASSAWLGALSHVFVDGFTHPGGFAVERIALLRLVVFEGHGLTVAKLLQYAGHTVGSALCVVLLARAIGQRKFSAWSGGLARGTHLRAPIFWAPAVFGVVLAVLAVITVSSTGGGLPAAVIRPAWSVFAGLAVGGALHRLSVA